MKQQLREIVPLIVIFLLFNNLFLFSDKWLAKMDINNLVLIIANTLFFIMSVIVYRVQQKSATNKNPNVFVRTVMGGTMVKMLVCLVFVVVYALAFKSSFTKMSVAAIMILYLIYLYAESKMAMKLNKSKNA